ncbi:MAG: hypothetical protein ABI840_10190 [bacterium]
MKPKFSTEELIQSLPDFITNKISDINLKSEIENELRINGDFKLEYNELKSTLGFLNSYDFESPSESYFNNLSVKINDRINNENITESFWKRLSLVWKILIPVIPVIILAIVLFSNLKEEKSTSGISENEINKTEITKEKINSSENKTEITKTENQINSNKEKPNAEEIKRNENSTLKLKKFNSNIKSRQSSEKNPDKDLRDEKNESDMGEDVSLNAELSDNIEMSDEEVSENNEDVLFSGDNIGEETLEQEFLTLPPDEQQEIIDNLNKAQI